MTERVAKRKTHRKSRNGCFQCKQRHTKVRATFPHVPDFSILPPIESHALR